MTLDFSLGLANSLDLWICVVSKGVCYPFDPRGEISSMGTTAPRHAVGYVWKASLYFVHAFSAGMKLGSSGTPIPGSMAPSQLQNPCRNSLVLGYELHIAMTPRYFRGNPHGSARAVGTPSHCSTGTDCWLRTRPHSHPGLVVSTVCITQAGWGFCCSLPSSGGPAQSSLQRARS